MRKRVADFAEALPVKTIGLGSNARLPGDYVAGHALGTTYTLLCPMNRSCALIYKQSFAVTGRSRIAAALTPTSRAKLTLRRNLEYHCKLPLQKSANTPIIARSNAIALPRTMRRSFIEHRSTPNAALIAHGAEKALHVRPQDLQ